MRLALVFRPWLLQISISLLLVSFFIIDPSPCLHQIAISLGCCIGDLSWCVIIKSFVCSSVRGNQLREFSYSTLMLSGSIWPSVWGSYGDCIKCLARECTRLLSHRLLVLMNSCTCDLFPNVPSISLGYLLWDFVRGLENNAAQPKTGEPQNVVSQMCDLESFLSISNLLCEFEPSPWCPYEISQHPSRLIVRVCPYSLLH